MIPPWVLTLSLVCALIAVILLAIYLPRPNMRSSAGGCAKSLTDKDCAAGDYCLANPTDPQCEMYCSAYPHTDQVAWCHEIFCAGEGVADTYECQCKNVTPTTCSQRLCGEGRCLQGVSQARMGNETTPYQIESIAFPGRYLVMVPISYLPNPYNQNNAYSMHVATAMYNRLQGEATYAIKGNRLPVALLNLMQLRNFWSPDSSQNSGKSMFQWVAQAFTWTSAVDSWTRDKDFLYTLSSVFYQDFVLGAGMPTLGGGLELAQMPFLNGSGFNVGQNGQTSLDEAWLQFVWVIQPVKVIPGGLLAHLYSWFRNDPKGGSASFDPRTSDCLTATSDGRVVMSKASGLDTQLWALTENGCQPGPNCPLFLPMKTQTLLNPNGTFNNFPGDHNFTARENQVTCHLALVLLDGYIVYEPAWETRKAVTRIPSGRLQRAGAFDVDVTIFEHELAPSADGSQIESWPCSLYWVTDTDFCLNFHGKGFVLPLVEKTMAIAYTNNMSLAAHIFAITA